MRIGIDISQLAYQNTGVANYLRSLVTHLLEIDKENEYVLFFSSLRGTLPPFDFPVRWVGEAQEKNVSIKLFKIPPTLLDLLWNKLHVMPIENLIGDVDVFITSDWTEPPVKRAKKMTILYDLVVYKYPEETAKNIVETQKRKLAWVKKETDMILCISEATKKDASEILEISEERMKVLYPGVTL
jgi:hypothetical protein